MFKLLQRQLLFVLTFTVGATAAAGQDEGLGTLGERVPAIMEAMGVRPGAVVADVGAGGGFLTVHLARAVGADGRVFAVDVNPRVVERLRARVDKEALSNVEVVHGTTDDPHLPPASVDAAVIVNAYHEMGEHEAMLHRLKHALKPEGRLVIVEPLSAKRRAASREEQVRAHEIAPRFVEAEAREAGFRTVRVEDPFANRAHDVMWLLVATPDPAAAHTAMCPLVRRKPPAPPATPPDADSDPSHISNPDLRVPFERFKQLHDTGSIVVVDVRTDGEFRAGHIPGAIWVPLDKLGGHAARLRAAGKPIVTYCS